MDFAGVKRFLPQVRTFCGFIDLKEGVYMITVFALLNKVSGLYGISSLLYGRITSTINYIYSIMAVAAFVYSLYGIYNEDLKILRVYPQLYCMDLVLNTIFTIIFGYSWYLVIDHTPKEEELSSEYANWQKQASPNALPAWKAESNVAILCLLVVWIIHVYFAVVIQSYADYMDKKYSLSTSNNNNNSRRSISGDALLSSPSNIDNSYRLTSVNALALSPSSTLNNDNSGSLRSNGRGGNISSRRVTIQDLEEGEDENYENNKNVF